jgi:hypothetical protein
MGRAGCVEGIVKNAHKRLAGKSEGKKPIWKPRPSWKYNIKIAILYERCCFSALHILNQRSKQNQLCTEHFGLSTSLSLLYLHHFLAKMET